MKTTLALLLLSAGALALTAEPYLAAEKSRFGATIEGAAVDKVGNIYAVSFDGSAGQAGQVTGEQKLLFQSAEEGALVNSIRFSLGKDGAEEAFVGDAALHQVYRLTGRKSDGTFANTATVCKDARMLQPNDLALAPSSGRLFLSGMNYTAGTGDLWTCDSAGVATLLGTFARTNGIEVSPDEKTLYLSEAENGKDGAVVANRVLAFDLDAASGAVSNKRVFVDFGKLDQTEATDVDGMRTDTSGNLYVTRNGIGKVSVFSPAGKQIDTIVLPSIDFVANLEFGGPSGTDLYMVGKCKADDTKGCVDVYRGTAVGRAFKTLSGSGEPEPTPETPPSGCAKTGRKLRK
ncbi:hypothetical protein H4R18_002584 [Coemansia javaensis]|uniref:SMP-30/Gluconolactonase/LRE-like region domain-containing protein n=1 Tax=Coemansia javaensis TaxID=2761396 RepID=A0A9W8HEK0_9FUNG|nr:hypothetical protein H4R18_002584 [Coemansia javaensis]